MRAILNKLRTLIGRVWSKIERRRESVTLGLGQLASSILSRVRRLLAHKPKEDNFYNLHAV